MTMNQSAIDHFNRCNRMKAASERNLINKTFPDDQLRELIAWAAEAIEKHIGPALTGLDIEANVLTQLYSHPFIRKANVSHEDIIFWFSDMMMEQKNRPASMV